MIGAAVFIILVVSIAVFLFGDRFGGKQKTREQYLEELAKFCEGTLSPLEDGVHENSYRITFEYAGYQCSFEDIEKLGFKDKIYYAYLKIAVKGSFILTFMEKEQSTKIRSDIFIASEISTQDLGHQVRLNVPSYLNEFKVYTNDTVMANRMLDDRKIASVLKGFKSSHIRGGAYLPIETVDGTVTLAFSSGKRFYPNLSSLKSNIPMIEDCLIKLLPLIRWLNQ